MIVFADFVARNVVPNFPIFVVIVSPGDNGGI